jgi:hypothetical protein
VTPRPCDVYVTVGDDPSRPPVRVLAVNAPVRDDHLPATALDFWRDLGTVYRRQNCSVVRLGTRTYLRASALTWFRLGRIETNQAFTWWPSLPPREVWPKWAYVPKTGLHHSVSECELLHAGRGPLYARHGQLWWSLGQPTGEGWEHWPADDLAWVPCPAPDPSGLLPLEPEEER